MSKDFGVTLSISRQFCLVCENVAPGKSRLVCYSRGKTGSRTWAMVCSV